MEEVEAEEEKKKNENYLKEFLGQLRCDLKWNLSHENNGERERVKWKWNFKSKSNFDQIFFFYQWISFSVAIKKDLKRRETPFAIFKYTDVRYNQPKKMFLFIENGLVNDTNLDVDI